MNWRSFVLIFLASIFINVTAHAQSKTWGESGASWRFDLLGNGGPFTQEVKYDHDTTINGKICEIYTTTSNFYYWVKDWYDGYYTGSGKTAEHIIFLSGDSLYQYNNGGFHLLHTLNANIGDSWDLGYDSISGLNCTKSIVEVIDTGHMNVQGNNLRFIELEMTNNNSKYVYDGIIFDKIGRVGKFIGFPPSLEGFVLPELNDQCNLDEPNINLRCYWDDYGINYFDGSSSNSILWDYCEFEYYVGEEEFDIPLIRLYPNPVNDKLVVENIQWQEYDSLELIDGLGSKINVNYSIESNRLLINTGQLKGGLYVLRLNYDNGRYSDFRVIKN